ncbi:MAG TPA: hypothetical protein DIV38_01640 [Clostridiales bacterium]|nr:hypothetical protein [Clostridiales bacterium]
METKSLKCPNCGAYLSLPPGENRVVCEYCGKEVHISLSEAERQDAAAAQNSDKNLADAYNELLATLMKNNAAAAPAAAPTRCEDVDDDDEDDDEYPSAEDEYGENGSAESTGKKKKSKGMIFSIIITLLFASVFAAGLLLTLMMKTSVGDIIMLVNGVFGAIMGTILYKIVDYRDRVICPVCGRKREHHRHWVKTVNRIVNDRSTGDQLVYTHYYKDTYVCPRCGETKCVDVKKSGGKIYEDNNGRTHDTRNEPVEF